ncbi:MAG: QueT transporter family protein [Anaerolineaceae bacterium]|jgi:energy-coupling factor transport system substrate-specific component|nr:QueT transporter family protein [Anaerolineaceae bacterium]
MKEVITMWKNTRMIILVALSAAIYAAFLIVFKGGIPIVPGVTEVRPANVFPPVFSLLFGPAGAWGSAIGNLIGDLFGGTLGIGSIFGFVGNFFLGFIPYKMWGSVFGLTSDDVSPTTNSAKKIAAFEIVALVASAACGIIIAWYLDLAAIVPFAFLAITITVNNFAAAVVLGPILLSLLYPRVKRWGLVWTDIMDVEDVAVGKARNLGSILMIVGAIGGLVVGLLVASGVAGQTIYGFTGEQSQVAVWASVLPFLLLIVVASVMLSGREQFVEDDED